MESERKTSMLKKSGIFVIATMFVSMISFSQTIKENIEKLSKDPKTVENASKADVYIADHKKIIGDTTTLQSTNNSNRIAKTTRKKKHCRK